MKNSPLLTAILLLSCATRSVAEPANARLFKAQFGYMPSCNACHRDGGGSPLNVYGQSFHDHKANITAFAEIGPLDADGDGVTNAEEIAAKANPGDAESTPSAPGDWLDMSKLIPRAVQESFPEVRLYKPVDAILTATEIEKAAAWGVTLDSQDENTIYVPVLDRKPVGTAVIVRGEYESEVFFLLVATDRQLAAQRVAPVSGDNLPVDGAGFYSQFVGKSATRFDVVGESLEEQAIASTVHKALALIQARLKK